MVRTQIQLTQLQADTLRALAAERGVSMAEVIRLSIDSFMHREGPSTREAKVERAKAAAGRFDSGANNVSTKHDEYLAEAFLGR